MELLGGSGAAEEGQEFVHVDAAIDVSVVLVAGKVRVSPYLLGWERRGGGGGWNGELGGGANGGETLLEWERRGGMGTGDGCRECGHCSLLTREDERNIYFYLFIFNNYINEIISIYI